MDLSTNRSGATAVLEPGTARPTSAPTPQDSAPHHGGLARLWRGRPDDHRAVRPALLALLVATGLLYLWGLGASGWANSFYSAAVQAGSESWKAFFFGSSDAASSITVDKTPASLWVMALSVRIFGLSSWSILVPQALIGVASVGALYATVRRTTSNAWAGIGAGAVLALTPVAVLMFRFNNPDALLVLLLIGSVHATLRALERPERAVRWLALGGALVGAAFLTKMLQAFLVLPALAGVYLLAASVPVLKRLGHLLVAFGSMLLAAGWWIAIVELWPASSRPYIGGSQDNSILELTLGYNGLGRLNGDETGSVGGGNGWGSTGLFRLFTSEIGGQIAWLLPAALALLVLGLWLRVRALGRAARTDRITSGLVVWGLWLIVTGLTFSFMAGIFHAYYTVALAPAIAAVVGIGAHQLWVHRDAAPAQLGAAFTIAMTSALAFVLLGRSSDFLPWLRWVVIVLGVASAVLIVVHQLLPRRFAIAVATGAVIAMLAGPTAYAVETAGTAHTGSIPTAGPSTGNGPGGMRGGPGGQMGQPPTQNGTTQNGTATMPGLGGTGRGGGAGGLLNGSTSSTQIDALLEADADSYTWVAAAVGSNTAAGYQLSTELPVMAIGGFNGSDPSPTLAEFKQLVADGAIHYFIAGGGFGGMGAGGGTSSAISSWVESTFTSTTVDGVTLYDLSTGVQ